MTDFSFVALRTSVIRFRRQLSVKCLLGHWTIFLTPGEVKPEVLKIMVMQCVHAQSRSSRLVLSRRRTTQLMGTFALQRGDVVLQEVEQTA